jgi:hypothetical protein
MIISIGSMLWSSFKQLLILWSILYCNCGFLFHRAWSLWQPFILILSLRYLFILTAQESSWESAPRVSQDHHCTKNRKPSLLQGWNLANFPNFDMRRYRVSTRLSEFTATIISTTLTNCLTSPKILMKIHNISNTPYILKQSLPPGR